MAWRLALSLSLPAGIGGGTIITADTALYPDNSMGNPGMKTSYAPWLGQAITLLLLSAPVAACAQAPDQAPSGQPMGHKAKAGVTLERYQQRHEGKLMAADTDGDGRISKAEFLAQAKAGGKGGKGNPEKRFAKRDLNHDGMLDKSEIDAMLARKFKRLDTNGDGMLSPQERAAGGHGARNKAAGPAAD